MSTTPRATRTGHITRLGGQFMDGRTGEGVSGAKRPFVRIISQCTGSKIVTPPNQLTLDDFLLDLHNLGHLDRRRALLPVYRADELYTGEQHRRVMRGIREAFGVHAELWIVSAAYGMVRAGEHLTPYSVTFNNMSPAGARAWARHLGIPTTVAEIAHQSWVDLTVFALGDAYLAA